MVERKGRAIVQSALLASKDASGSTLQLVEQSANAPLVPIEAAKGQVDKEISGQTATPNPSKKRKVIKTLAPRGPAKESKKKK